MLGVGLSYNNVGPEYYPRSDSCVTLMMLMSHDVSIILHSLYYFRNFLSFEKPE